MKSITPPNAPELEQAVIGSVLSGTTTLDEVSGVITSKQLYDPKHKKVLQVMEALHSEDVAVDALTVEDRVGFPVHEYVNEGSVRPLHHAKIIKQYATRRYVGSRLPEFVKRAYDVDYNLHDLIDEISRLPVELDSGEAHQASSAWEVLQNPAEGGSQLEMNVEKFDNALFKYNGFRRGTYTAIFADSGHGKTTTMIMFAANLIMSGKHVYWSDHEGAKEYVIRPLYDYVQQKSPPEYVEEIMKRFYITDDCHDISDVKRTARMLKRDGKLDCMFVDYIQNVDNKRYKDDTEIVKNTSKELNKLKSELNCAVIVGSQVTLKGADRRSGWSLAPRDNDWRDSGQIKQDADYILSVFRPIKIDSLQEEVDGRLYAKDWNGSRIHKDSVFMHPVKVRGVLEFNRVHMVHNYYGLDFMEK